MILTPASVIYFLNNSDECLHAYLRNCERIVQVTESIELPLLSLDSDEELLDTLQRQLVTLYQNPG